MFSPSTSTASLVSSTTVSSRAPLNGSTTARPKDYQSAFASLQSAYGFSDKNVNTSTVPAPATHVQSQAADKNFQSAFADLQSTYGFGGIVPSPISKSKNNK
ncbi:hypothetical protein K438DRAFT_1756431 [Mycena galopus ATCC 62051]|nr:hypothetical protein K438DRAFT_1756431 [Mycena galopus ATCC 62051]